MSPTLIGAIVGIVGTLAITLVTNWQAERRRKRDQDRDDRLRREDLDRQRASAWRADLYAAYTACFTPLMEAAAAAKGFIAAVSENQVIDEPEAGEFVLNCTEFSRQTALVQLISPTLEAVDKLSRAGQSASIATLLVLIQSENIPQLDQGKVNRMTAAVCEQLRDDYLSVLDQFRADLEIAPAESADPRDQKDFGIQTTDLDKTVGTLTREIVERLVQHPGDKESVERALATLNAAMNRTVHMRVS